MPSPLSLRGGNKPIDINRRLRVGGLSGVGGLRGMLIDRVCWLGVLVGYVDKMLALIRYLAFDPF